MRNVVAVKTEDEMIRGGLLAIENLNLVKALHRLQSPSPRGKGWTTEQAVEAEKWYRRFLTLRLKNPTAILVPTEDVDEL